jgi:hypothetical protein
VRLTAFRLRPAKAGSEGKISFKAPFLSAATLFCLFRFVDYEMAHLSGASPKSMVRPAIDKDATANSDTT